MTKDRESDMSFFDRTLYQSVVKRRLLTREEEIELIGRAQAGDSKALDLMVHFNVRLVLMYAARYANRGLEYKDLVQQGMLGLIKAVERFELDKGVRFSTYATWWIEHAMRRGLADLSRLIRIPVHRTTSFSKSSKKLRRAMRHLEHDVTLADIAEDLGIDEEETALIAHQMSGSNLSLENDMDVSSRPGQHVSSTRFKDMVPDDSLVQEERIDAAKSTSRASEIIALAMKALGRREATVIRRRIFKDPPDTLQHIGEDMRLSRERIRQIQETALDKMRSRIVSLGLVEECTDILELFGGVADRPGYGECVERASPLLGPPERQEG